MYSLLFREDSTNLKEAEAAKKVFGSLYHTNRSSVPRDFLAPRLCIGRYSVLPFYTELETDLKPIRLINSHEQHSYIADAQYIKDLGELTFKTWTDADFYLAPEGEYVVKGATNSRKHQWNTSMFAPTKAKASLIGHDLSTDSLIGSQDIIYRRFEKLETYEYLLSELPVTNEWRLFFLGNKLIDYGYYWSNAKDLKTKDELEPAGLELGRKAAEILKDHVNFFVVDVAKKESGEWIVVEVNDGQMSGLSTISPEEFYSNLRRIMATMYIEVIENLSKKFLEIGRAQYPKKDP